MSYIHIPGPVNDFDMQVNMFFTLLRHKLGDGSNIERRYEKNENYNLIEYDFKIDNEVFMRAISEGQRRWWKTTSHYDYDWQLIENRFVGSNKTLRFISHDGVPDIKPGFAIFKQVPSQRVWHEHRMV